MVVQESFSPKAMTASGVVLPAAGGALGGFLCTVAGNVKLTYGLDGTGATIVDTVAVTVGQFLPMPFAFGPGTGVYATLSNGAQGTFAVN